MIKLSFLSMNLSIPPVKKFSIARNLVYGNVCTFSSPGCNHWNCENLSTFTLFSELLDFVLCFDDDDVLFFAEVNFIQQILIKVEGVDLWNN